MIWILVWLAFLLLGSGLLFTKSYVIAGKLILSLLGEITIMILALYLIIMAAFGGIENYTFVVGLIYTLIAIVALPCIIWGLIKKKINLHTAFSCICSGDAHVGRVCNL